MDVLVVLAILVILAAVVWVVGAPLRHGVDETSSDELDELLAEKEAKYREIRDAELDHRTGKLDDTDFKTIDRQLRAEAVVILRRLDQLGGDDR